MDFTKKVIAAVLIAGFLATFLVLPQAAEAGGRHWNHGGPRYYHNHSGPGPFWGGLAVGAVSGLVVGSSRCVWMSRAPGADRLGRSGELVEGVDGGSMPVAGLGGRTWQLIGSQLVVQKLGECPPSLHVLPIGRERRGWSGGGRAILTVTPQSA